MNVWIILGDVILTTTTPTAAVAATTLYAIKQWKQIYDEHTNYTISLIEFELIPFGAWVKLCIIHETKRRINCV